MPKRIYGMASKKDSNALTALDNCFIKSVETLLHLITPKDVERSSEIFKTVKGSSDWIELSSDYNEVMRLVDRVITNRDEMLNFNHPKESWVKMTKSDRYVVTEGNPIILGIPELFIEGSDVTDLEIIAVLKELSNSIPFSEGLVQTDYGSYATTGGPLGIRLTKISN